MTPALDVPGIYEFGVMGTLGNINEQLGCFDMGYN